MVIFHRIHTQHRSRKLKLKPAYIGNNFFQWIKLSLTLFFCRLKKTRITCNLIKGYLTSCASISLGKILPKSPEKISKSRCSYLKLSCQSIQGLLKSGNKLDENFSAFYNKIKQTARTIYSADIFMKDGPFYKLHNLLF